MNYVANLYVDKVVQIYDGIFRLQELSKEKSDSFELLANFRERIVENVEIIKQFKNIPNDICKHIDNGNFDNGIIDIVEMVENFANNIKKTKRFFTNEQIAEFEKLIEDCFNNMSFSTAEKYKIILERTNKRLSKLFRERIVKLQDCIFANGSHTIGLKTDGTVIATGRYDRRAVGKKADGTLYWIERDRGYESELNNTKDWRNIVAISAYSSHTIGLKADGTVVATGRYGYTFRGNTAVMEHEYKLYGTKEWRDIVAISTSDSHTVGLKSNGTVVAVGNNNYGQCNTENWRDIVAICAGHSHTVGLKSDGTVVSTEDRDSNIENWSDIVAIYTEGSNDTVGLKTEGTLVANLLFRSYKTEIESWRNIVAISLGSEHIVGLKADGTVVAAGKNDDGQCNTSFWDWDDRTWEDIVAISAGGNHTAGLKADGTVVAVGNNEYGQCNTESWEDIIAISACYLHTVGLKADGTVVVVGKNDDGQCNTKSWKNVGLVNKEQILQRIQEEEKRERQRRIEEEKRERQRRIEEEKRERQRREKEEQRRIEQSKCWQEDGLCKSCGGKFSFLGKKCKSCGKPKDY